MFIILVNGSPSSSLRVVYCMKIPSQYENSITSQHCKKCFSGFPLSFLLGNGQVGALFLHTISLFICSLFFVIYVTYLTPKNITFIIYYTIIFLFVARKSSSSINSGVVFIWFRKTTHKKKYRVNELVKKRVLIIWMKVFFFVDIWTQLLSRVVYLYIIWRLLYPRGEKSIITRSIC